jgi:hypothetical protein
MLMEAVAAQSMAREKSHRAYRLLERLLKQQGAGKSPPAAIARLLRVVAAAQRAAFREAREARSIMKLESRAGRIPAGKNNPRAPSVAAKGRQATSLKGKD